MPSLVFCVMGWLVGLFMVGCCLCLFYCILDDLVVLVFVCVANW